LAGFQVTLIGRFWVTAEATPPAAKRNAGDRDDINVAPSISVIRFAASETPFEPAAAGILAAGSRPASSVFYPGAAVQPKSQPQSHLSGLTRQIGFQDDAEP
jgi:hypothetical protein